MSLIRNSLWNILGYAIPSFVAIPALGYLARALGTQQFGLFTLALAIVGYASIFDAGITRSVIREISFFRDDQNERKKIVTTSIFCMLFMGFLGFSTLLLLSPFTMEILNVTSINESVVKSSVIIVGLCIPIFLINQLFMGFMEGEEKFGHVNTQKIIANIFIAGMPALFVYFDKNLNYAVYGLLCGRIIGMLIAIYLSRLTFIVKEFHFHKIVFFRLLKFGGWITVSNIISPIMTIADRFILSHLMGANNIAFYTAPSEGVARLTIIPAALSRAIFPKLSYAKNQSERLKHQRLGYLILLMACLPVAIVVFIFASDILRLWMGVAFSASEPTLILRILVIGFVFNAIAQIPYASIQAKGKAHYTAAIHLIELVPYIYLLFYMISKLGLIGVAYAWLARTFVDFLLLLVAEIAIEKNL
ncbi:MULTISPECIES: flippase [Enterobacter]|uniref:flippase n=1 Tax=Enterobacter TaxID=547 RepID=UPI001F5A82A9|nr:MULTISPECIES: flippase [Enterobacter]MCI2291179.1 flippase [Enterobacter sp. I4]MCY0773133.1 flippase [Enterobacter cloacae complex sp. 2022EL-00788]